MPAKVVGIPELQARLKALEDKSGHKRFLGELGAIAVARAMDNVPRKTGFTAGLIKVVELTDTHVTVGSLAEHSLALELGSKAHTILPRRKRALRFAATSAGARLSGSPRRGAGVVFARRVRHPGTSPHPFMKPALLDTAKLAPGKLKAHVVKSWNGAA